MFTDVLIGPVLHWIDPDIFRGATPGFGSLAPMLILFEGGLDLKVPEILNHFVCVDFAEQFGVVNRDVSGEGTGGVEAARESA